MGLVSWLREHAQRSGTHTTPERPKRSFLGLKPGISPRDAAAAAERKRSRTAAQTSQAAAWPGEGWEELPAYLPVDPSEHRTVCVVASAIAAGDYPQSSFTVKSVSVTNPEYQRVTCIATALAAGDSPSSSFYVKRIYKQTSSEASHAA